MTRWATPWTRHKDIVGAAATTGAPQSVSINVNGDNYGQIAARDINNYAPPRRSLVGREMDARTARDLLSAGITPIQVGYADGNSEAYELCKELAGNLRMIGLPISDVWRQSIGIMKPLVVASPNTSETRDNPMWVLATWLREQGLDVEFLHHAEANVVIVGPAPAR